MTLETFTLSAKIMLSLKDGLITTSDSFRKISAFDKSLSLSDFISSCFTELKGGSNFVTERFLEKSKFSLEIIGANKKTKPRSIRKPDEKLSLLSTKSIFFLKKKTNGSNKRKSIEDMLASIKLKFKTATTAAESFNNNNM